MKRAALLISGLALVATLFSAVPASAKLGDHGALTTYNRTAHKAWVTVYKQQLLGNRTIVGSGWMAAGGHWTLEVVNGNTYHIRAEVVDGHNSVIYDTIVERDDKSNYAATLMQGTGNYYWK